MPHLYKYTESTAMFIYTLYDLSSARTRQWKSSSLIKYLFILNFITTDDMLSHLMRTLETYEQRLPVSPSTQQH